MFRICIFKRAQDMSKRHKANGGAKRSLAMSSAESIALAEELDEIEELDLSTPPKVMFLCLLVFM